jgi:hypothetical protein
MNVQSAWLPDMAVPCCGGRRSEQVQTKMSPTNVIVAISLVLTNCLKVTRTFRELHIQHCRRGRLSSMGRVPYQSLENTPKRPQQLRRLEPAQVLESWIQDFRFGDCQDLCNNKTSNHVTLHSLIISPSLSGSQESG